MINTVMLVGRLTRNPEMLECDNGNKVSRITLAVNRKFKNADGLYTTDFIDCILWNNTAKHLNDYCKKGTGTDCKSFCKALSPVFVSGEGSCSCVDTRTWGWESNWTTVSSCKSTSTRSCQTLYY